MNLMTWLETGGDKKGKAPAFWQKICIKPDQVVEVLRKEYEWLGRDMQWKKQLEDARRLVSDQLVGVSDIMKDLSQEISYEANELIKQEKQIEEALETLGLAIRHVKVLSLEEGNIEIEILHLSPYGEDECRKLAAPLLSEIIGEHIAVKESCRYNNDDGWTIVLGSAKSFNVETGVASAAKGGGLISGDCFSTLELGQSQYAIAMSDGMGNGERANIESRTALELLKQLLKCGMDVKVAIKAINSVLILRSQEEMFATLDLALIDLHTAEARFLKKASAPSFIKRGDEVFAISDNNLPIGMIQNIEVEMVRSQLKPGDLLIMMTDGAYDPPAQTLDADRRIRRMITEIETRDPQTFADLLLEKVIRDTQGEIRDDMSIMVTRVERYTPEWATFTLPGLERIERPKVLQ
jgi:stage II sporulation protein E